MMNSMLAVQIIQRTAPLVVSASWHFTQDFFVMAQAQKYWMDW